MVVVGHEGVDQGSFGMLVRDPVDDQKHRIEDGIVQVIMKNFLKLGFLFFRTVIGRIDVSAQLGIPVQLVVDPLDLREQELYLTFLIRQFHQTSGISVDLDTHFFMTSLTKVSILSLSCLASTLL